MGGNLKRIEGSGFIMTDREFLYFLMGYFESCQYGFDQIKHDLLKDKIREHLGFKGKVEVNGLPSNLKNMAPSYTPQNGHVFQPPTYATPNIGSF